MRSLFATSFQPRVPRLLGRSRSCSLSWGSFWPWLWSLSGSGRAVSTRFAAQSHLLSGYPAARLSGNLDHRGPSGLVSEPVGDSRVDSRPTIACAMGQRRRDCARDWPKTLPAPNRIWGRKPASPGLLAPSEEAVFRFGLTSHPMPLNLDKSCVRPKVQFSQTAREAVHGFSQCLSTRG